jgi:hypothetical protein
VLGVADRNPDRLDAGPLLFERKVFGQLRQIIVAIVDAAVSLLVRFKSSAVDRLAIVLQVLLTCP